MSFKESTTLELKSSWEDSSGLKTICAFANTEGGSLYIGIDDHYKPIGLVNIKKHLEDIPNKILSKLSIIPKVSLENMQSQEILNIKISPSEVPVSYNGKYFIRTGSTTQELTGKNLTKFLISKSHYNWDEYAVPEATIKDINLDTLERFKFLAKEKLPYISQEMNIKNLLEKLNLITNGHLKRAAVLLFCKEPQKYITSAYMKIGKFNSASELVGTDIVKGNLFEQIENTMTLLKVKYLISPIHFEGIHRKETLELPEEVWREAIMNAIVHRDYIGAHTQLKIYPNKISLWNEGSLLPPMTINDLKKEHPSRPRNALIADIFYKAGLIETWGHGTLKMIADCIKENLPEPEYLEEFGGFSVIFHEKFKNSHDIALNERQKKAIKYIKKNKKITNSIYQKINSVSKATATIDLMDLVNKNILIKRGARGAGTIYLLKDIA